jgi:hypothetical protein
MTRHRFFVPRHAVAPVLTCVFALGLGCVGAFAQALPGDSPAGIEQQTAKPPAAPVTQAPKPSTPAAKPPAAKPPAAKTAPAKPAGPAFRISGFGEVGYTYFTAHDSFDAVLGSSGGVVFGGGATVAHRSGYFGRVGIERFDGDGERVYVYGGEVFPMGIPLSVSITPIDFTGGYRFVAKPKPVRTTPPRPAKPAFQPAKPQPTDKAKAPPAPAAAARPPAPRPVRRWVPYVGGGVGFLSYKETSDFPGGSEDVSETLTSYHVLGGIDFPVAKWIGVGAEAAWRFVPNGLEDSPVGQEFGEKDLGGLTVRVLVVVGR